MPALPQASKQLNPALPISSLGAYTVISILNLICDMLISTDRPDLTQVYKF
jgi:hypothetical protein